MTIISRRITSRTILTGLGLALVAVLAAVLLAGAADAKVNKIKPKDGAYVTKISTTKSWGYIGVDKKKIFMMAIYVKFGGCDPVGPGTYGSDGLREIYAYLAKPKKPNKQNKFSFKIKQHPSYAINLSVNGKFKSANKATFTVKGTAGGCDVAKRTFNNAKWQAGG